MEYNEGVEIRIITNNVTAKECLLPLLNELKYMGGIGASRSIKIEDWDGKSNFGIDGDGSHSIKDIYVNGKKYKGEKMKKSKASKISHETPPKEYKEEGATKRSDYADPKRYKYPLHTESNARSALQYFSKPKNRSGYSPEEVKKVGKRIINACKKYGIEVSEESYRTFGLKPPMKKSLRECLENRLRKSKWRE